MKGTLSLIALSTLFSLAAAQSNVVRLDPGDTRTRADIARAADLAVRNHAVRSEALIGDYRARRLLLLGLGEVSTMLPPTRVETGAGTFGATQSGDLVLVFDETGERAFPESYRTFLEAVFANAKATMNLVFGAPASGGQVRVRNYDADIGDRNAVAGGFYLPNNGAGEREIRFPVYLNSETAAVNFIHTLLLAYQGDKTYAFDAFQEGLVRAATMKVARTPAAMSGLDQASISATLLATYEVGPWYDWYNQRSLAARQFIAPNLRNVPLPAGGSIGGIYLLRFMMAGSAWEKVLVEYPTFIKELNTRFYQQPALRNNVPGLVNLAQNVLNDLRPANPQVEGRTFPQWYRRQYVLDTHITRGLKLHVAPQPIVFGLEGQDFGVFDFQTTYFETLAGGNERLLSATSYPIFWNSTFDRLFPSAQDERMDIVAAYGSVTPNFPNENAGIPYRVATDIPVADQLVRVHVPAGAVATAQKPAANDFYGTVEGVRTGVGISFSVRASIGGSVIANAPVTDGAYGVRINTALWRTAQPVLLEVLRTQGETTTTVFTERVNKAPGSLAVDLRVGGEDTVNMSAFKGINLLGFPVDPFDLWQPDVLNIPLDRTLVARWNPSLGKYDLFPDVEPFQIGHGYFARMPEPRSLAVDGQVAPPLTPWSVALKPGWNLVSNPLREAVSKERVLVVRGTGFPTTFNEAAGTDVGVDIFGFVRGNPDPVSGVPEAGSYAASALFEAGRALFVRCLAPEGATLTFYPSLADSNVQQRLTVARPQDWRIRVKAREGTRTVETILVMSKTATNGFDPTEDSSLPPSMGGFQAASMMGAQAMYRDVRPTASSATYTVRLDGLRAGVAYTVDLSEEISRAKSFTVARDGGALKTYQGSAKLEFVAGSTTSTLTVKVVR